MSEIADALPDTVVTAGMRRSHEKKTIMTGASSGVKESGMFTKQRGTLFFFSCFKR